MSAASGDALPLPNEASSSSRKHTQRDGRRPCADVRRTGREPDVDQPVIRWVERRDGRAARDHRRNRIDDTDGSRAGIRRQTIIDLETYRGRPVTREGYGGPGARRGSTGEGTGPREDERIAIRIARSGSVERDAGGWSRAFGNVGTVGIAHRWIVGQCPYPLSVFWNAANDLLPRSTQIRRNLVIVDNAPGNVTSTAA